MNYVDIFNLGEFVAVAVAWRGCGICCGCGRLRSWYVVIGECWGGGML